MHDLAVILVSHNGVRWINKCLTTLYARVGDCTVDVVVVSNSDDGTSELVATEFPQVRVIRCENRGFAHANNQGLVTCNARYALLLNVDTELLDGDLGSLVAALDARPSTGAAGVRQVTPRGDVAPTIRWFPTALRAFGESLGAERWPVRSRRLGERELDLSAYEREQLCDWVSGSFLVLRSEALTGVGLLDERFFLYSEEPDLCLRLKRAGWEVRYLPILTILHHAGNTGATPRLAAQDAYSRKQFAQKHFSVSERAAYRASLAVGYAIRSVSSSPAGRRAASRAALRAILGLGSPPFATPPSRSLTSRPAVHR